MATTIYVRDAADAVVCEVTTADPPIPPLWVPTAYNFEANRMKLTAEIRNRDNPGAPWWVNDSGGRLIFGKICIECASALP